MEQLRIGFRPPSRPALFDRNDLGGFGLEFSHFSPKIHRQFLTADVQNEPLLRHRRGWFRNNFVFHDCDVTSETGAEVRKARRAQHVGPVAATKHPVPAKARPAKKAATKRASAKDGSAGRTSGRGGTKTEKILALLKRPGGTTLKELTKATGWQPHSVRGFLSGVITKKLKLKVASAKDESGVRRYSVKA